MSDPNHMQELSYRQKGRKGKMKQTETGKMLAVLEDQYDVALCYKMLTSTKGIDTDHRLLRKHLYGPRLVTYKDRGWQTLKTVNTEVKT